MTYPAQPTVSITTRTALGSPLTTIQHDANLEQIASVAAHIGSVVEWYGIESTIPSGWVPIDGRSLVVANHLTLFDILEYKYGGSGANFNIPDARGVFTRMVDTTSEGSAGVDPDEGTRTLGEGVSLVGSAQADELRAHTHTYHDISHAGYGYDVTSGSPTQQKQLDPTSSTGGNETRPINMYAFKIMRII